MSVIYFTLDIHMQKSHKGKLGTLFKVDYMCPSITGNTGDPFDIKHMHA